MPPLRRYLRISSHSVLEVRIYLDNPADATRWLLSAREPMLGRIMEAVRPLVLPKLKEENDRARGRGKGKGAKKKGVRDVVVTDDFEVSIFLTELSSRHSILKKEKTFVSKGGRIKSNSAKMTGTREVPIDVVDEEEEAHRSEVLVRRESTEEDDDGLPRGLHSIPFASHDVVEEEEAAAAAAAAAVSGKARQAHDESLFVSENSEDSDFEKMPTPERGKATNPPAVAEGVGEEAGELQDDKKKAAFKTTYDGYSIYGRILCLIVKRKGQKGKPAVGGGAGQAMMEEWITSTQAMEEGGMMDD